MRYKIFSNGRNALSPRSTNPEQRLAAETTEGPL